MAGLLQVLHALRIAKKYKLEVPGHGETEGAWIKGHTPAENPMKILRPSWPKRRDARNVGWS